MVRMRGERLPQILRTGSGFQKIRVIEPCKMHYIRGKPELHLFSAIAGRRLLHDDQ